MIASPLPRPGTHDRERRLDRGTRRVAQGAWVWGPVVLWLGVIALMSGELGSHARSDVWVWRLLHEWLPGLFGARAPASAPTFLPVWARKLAHVTEYAVLGALAVRAFQRTIAPDARTPYTERFPGLRRLPAAVVMALPLCAAVAVLDELHQSTLASRTGSARDVAYDVAGVTLGLLSWGRLWWRRSRGSVDSG